MNINPLDRIQSYYDSLTKTDMEISIYIFNHPHEIINMSADDLAKKSKTSKAAISRFCQHVGYKGYLEFRYDLSRFLLIRNSEINNENKNVNQAVSITDLYCDYIKQIPEAVSEKEITTLAKDFINAKKVKFFGRNRTFNSANHFSLRLSRIGIDAPAYDDAISMGDMAYMLSKDDMAFIFTTRDNGHFYGNIVKQLKESGTKVACITATPALPFKKYCDHYICLPRISKDSSLTFVDDQPVIMVFIEILVNAIVSLMEEAKNQE